MSSSSVGRRWGVMSALVVLISAGWGGAAGANHVPGLGLCGDTITTNTTLTADVGPCPAGGLIIGADNVTLNLNGHSILGVTQVQGDSVGILVADRTGVTVKNGTVQDFDGGIAIDGGSGNTIMNMVVQDNVGSLATDYGEGIGVFVSDGNVIKNSTVQRNGPYAGIGLYAFTITGSASTTTNGNLVQGNVVADNNSVPTSVTSSQDDGIRLEPGVTNNVIKSNTVTGSGLDGIAVFARATGNTVKNNVVSGNGNHLFTHRKGHGIVVFLTANNTTVDGNTVCGNYGSGVRVDSANNTVRNNTAGTGDGCAQNHVANEANTFELQDTTALPTDGVTTTCNTNSWTGNVTHPAGTPNHAYNNACTIHA